MAGPHETRAGKILARCETLAELNAFISIDRERVLAAARALDERHAAGETPGPLAGVLVAVKDAIDVAGWPTTSGTPEARRPRRTAPVVQRLLDAGALVLGKTNLDERCRGLTTSNPHHGPALNPWDPRRSPGGSSGGSAAAVAARLADVGLGTDTAGSVRIPAAHCGIAGFRPSTGRYPIEGVLPLSPVRDTVGTLAARVADLALLDAVIAGGGPAPGVEPSKLRIGVPRGYYFERLDPAIEEAIEAALERWRRLGVTLVELDAPGDMARRCKEIARGLEEAERQGGARAGMERLRDEFTARCDDAGVLAAAFPATPRTAPPAGSATDWTHLRNTVPGSLVGGPGLVLPAGPTVTGLPAGIELDAPPGRDAAVLAAGRALERAT